MNIIVEFDGVPRKGDITDLKMGKWYRTVVGNYVTRVPDTDEHAILLFRRGSIWRLETISSRWVSGPFFECDSTFSFTVTND